MPKNKKLTLKQTKFIKYYFECGGNGTKAARLAGYKGNAQTLKQVGVENLLKPAIQQAIEEIKKKNGLSDELLLQKHLNLINAKKKTWIDTKKKFIEIDDHYIQLGALKLAYEINGKLKKDPLIDKSTHYHFTYDYRSKPNNSTIRPELSRQSIPA